MNIAIAGYGIEGKVSYEYWKAAGHDVTIVDERDLNPYELPVGNEPILGKNAFKKLHEFDMVVRTASLAPVKLKTSKKVWSATNEFFARCPSPIIGVTGTKGKGTTASFITSILTSAGKTVHLVGNIGVPALSVLASIKADDIVVYELSSFQLWDLKKSPHTSIVLMIEQDHLEVHSGMDDYVAAKSNIRRNQTGNDMCIYHATNPLSHKVAHSSRGGKLVRYGVPDDGGVYIKDDTFFARNIPLCSTSAVQLPGQHNLENACAAITATLQYTTDVRAVETGLRAFKGLPHRLKLVREANGVRYYDDSIATTPGSAIAAIDAISGPKLLILGGSDKGADYSELIGHCKKTETHVLAVGALGGRLGRLCKSEGAACTVSKATSMAKIVAEASRLVPKGGSVILSPAAASFDMFKSYSDRGEQFVAAVETLS
jgi:UDP-N-acetylmuramoylalanine--D-glutamate ligase